LSSEYDDHISHHVIDRSFIDAGGMRWIIDYKTAFAMKEVTWMFSWMRR